jgi:secretion/DNA translocation related TadE-like protein
VIIRIRNRIRDSDRGSGTVLVLALVAAAGTVLLTISLLFLAETGRGAAQAAADLASLAAAGRLADTGPGVDDGAVEQACALARQTAALNGCELVGCRYRGDGVVDVVAVRGTVVGVARAAARAGPSPGAGSAWLPGGSGLPAT